MMFEAFVEELVGLVKDEVGCRRRTGRHLGSDVSPRDPSPGAYCTALAARMGRRAYRAEGKHKINTGRPEAVVCRDTHLKW
jgi:hypothetical protein